MRILLLLVVSACFVSLIESKSPKNKAGHGHGHGGKGHHGHGGRGHHGHHEKELLGYKAFVEQLLEQKLDIDAQQNITGNTLLISAVEHGLVDLVAPLVNKNATLDIKNNKGLTALMIIDHKGVMAMHGNPKNMTEAAKAKAAKKHEQWRKLANMFRAKLYPTLNCPNDIMPNALRNSAKLAEVNMVSKLLACGVNPNGDHKHHSVLFETIIQMSNETRSNNGGQKIALLLPIVKELIKYDAKIYLHHKGDGNTVLHVVAADGNYELFKMFVDKDDHGINMRNKQGSTALMLAAGAGNLKIVQNLLDKNATIEKTDIAGQTALMYALKKASDSNTEIVKLLLKEGAATNVMDKDNNSVMDLARKLGPEGKEVYQALIDTTQNKVLLPILDTFNKNIFDISGR